MVADEFSERLASGAPTPGGGAAAARAGRHAAALLRMALAITLAKRDAGKASAAGADWNALVDAGREAARLSALFEELEARDMAAFERFLEALRLPRATPEEKARRRAERFRAAEGATRVPIEILSAAVRTLDLSMRLLDPASGQPLKAESDLGCAVELAHAAFRSAEMNVAVNLPELEEGVRLSIESEWRELRSRAAKAYGAARLEIARKLGLPAEEPGPSP